MGVNKLQKNQQWRTYEYFWVMPTSTFILCVELMNKVIGIDFMYFMLCRFSTIIFIYIGSWNWWKLWTIKHFKSLTTLRHKLFKVARFTTLTLDFSDFQFSIYHDNDVFLHSGRCFDRKWAMSNNGRFSGGVISKSAQVRISITLSLLLYAETRVILLNICGM